MTDGRAQELTHELIHAGCVLAAAGFLPATDGNLSARLDATRILITASGIEKRDLVESAFVPLDLDSPDPGRASTEWLMHRAIYRSRPHVQAVLHVHAPFLTTFAVAHRTPDTGLLAESYMTLGGIVLVPFCTPGTADVGDVLIRTSTHAGIYLLANHGAVAVGASVREAQHRLERAEFLARIQWQTETLGGAIPLSDEQRAALDSRLRPDPYTQC